MGHGQVEASALQSPLGLTRSRRAIATPLLRLRSDEQLVALFRAGQEEAFRTIHDRYRQRLFAYARQMLGGSRADAEDALQDIFVRAYTGLGASDRELVLRPWLYRIAHNRCIDELRRPPMPPLELLELVRAPIRDPTAEAEQRESIRRLLQDVQRLPQQQRSALLMRELGGMSYNDMAAAMAVSVPAIKSLLVRARVGLVQAVEARNVSCTQIREELVLAQDRGVRAGAMARRHMRDCESCRTFRTEVRGVSRQFAAIVPVGLLAKVLGLGGVGGFGGIGGGAGGGAAASGSAAAAGGAIGTGGIAGAIGAGHVATLLAAAVVTAGSAVEIQHTIVQRTHHLSAPRAIVRTASPAPPASPAQAAGGPIAASVVPASKPAAALPQSASSAAKQAGAAKRAVAVAPGATSSTTRPATVAPAGVTPTTPLGSSSATGDAQGTASQAGSGSGSTGTGQAAASGAGGTDGQPGASAPEGSTGVPSTPDPGTSQAPSGSVPGASVPTATPVSTSPPVSTSGASG